MLSMCDLYPRGSIHERARTRTRATIVLTPTYFAMTWFSEAKHGFLPVSEGGNIPTQPFLLACSEIVPFFGIIKKYKCLYIILFKILACSALTVVLYLDADNTTLTYFSRRCPRINRVYASKIRYQWKHTGWCVFTCFMHLHTFTSCFALLL